VGKSAQEKKYTGDGALGPLWLLTLFTELMYACQCKSSC
jgi:hypothetical protein